MFQVSDVVLLFGSLELYSRTGGANLTDTWGFFAVINTIASPQCADTQEMAKVEERYFEPL